MGCGGRYTGIIQSLIDEGVVVLYHDYRSGSWDDLSGNGNDVIPTAPTTINSRGARLNLTGRMDIASSLDVDFGSFDSASFVFYFPDGLQQDPTGANRFIQTSFGDYFVSNEAGPSIFVNIDSVISSAVVDFLNTKCQSFSWTDGEKPKFYIDGVYIDDGNIVLNKHSASPQSAVVGTTTAYGRQIPSTFGAVLATNRALTADEHFAVYEELRAMTWPTKTWSRDTGRVCVDPSATGLVAAYDMHPCDGVIKDLSGNGNDGTINGPVFENTPIGGSMRFDGSKDQNIDLGTGFQSLTDVTVSCWVKTSGIDASTVFPFIFSYFESNTDGWGISVRDSAGTKQVAINDDIDNANNILYPTTLPLDRPVHIVAQMSSLENKLYMDGELVGSGSVSSDNWSSIAGTAVVGNRYPLPDVGAASYRFSDNLVTLAIFDRALSADEIAELYQCGAQAVNFKTDYGVCESVAAETSGELSNSPFRIESGSFQISTDTIDGDTCKVIECVTAGVLAVPSAYFLGDETGAAYGTWEWWFLKNGGRLRVAFVGDNSVDPNDPSFNGYTINYASNNSVQTVEFSAGTPSTLNGTALGYISDGTWTKWAVTRSSAGVITTYINGSPVTVDTGTNPVTDTTHTTSKYIVLDLDAGDKIAYAAPNGTCSIVKYQGVV